MEGCRAVPRSDRASYRHGNKNSLTPNAAHFRVCVFITSAAFVSVRDLPEYRGGLRPVDFRRLGIGRVFSGFAPFLVTAGHGLSYDNTAPIERPMTNP